MNTRLAKIKATLSLLHSSQLLTLAERIDYYYDIYQNLKEELAGPNESDFSFIKEILHRSFTFLKIVLDVKDEEALGRAMKKRLSIHQYNPEYIPNAAPNLRLFANQDLITRLISFPAGKPEERRKLEEQKVDLKKLARYHIMRAATTQLGLYRNRIKDVNQDDQKFDEEKKTISKTAKERDRYRIIVHQGKFLKRAADDRFVAADTGSFIGHYLRGYAGFVMSPTGEISIFNHYNTSDKITHSTWVEKKQAFCAGLLRIENGKLLEIVDHSGHFKPDEENLAEFLNYLRQKGVDVSQVKINLYKPVQTLQRIEPSDEILRVYQRDRGYTYTAEDLLEGEYAHLIAGLVFYSEYKEIYEDLTKIEGLQDDAKDNINDFNLEEMEAIYERLWLAHSMLLKSELDKDVHYAIKNRLKIHKRTIEVKRNLKLQKESKSEGSASELKVIIQFAGDPHLDPEIKLQVLLPFITKQLQTLNKEQVHLLIPQEARIAMEAGLSISPLVHRKDDKGFSFLLTCTNLNETERNSFLLAGRYHHGHGTQVDLGMALALYDKAFNLSSSLSRREDIYNTVLALSLPKSKTDPLAQKKAALLIAKMRPLIFGQPKDDQDVIISMFEYLERMHYQDSIVEAKVVADNKSYPDKILDNLKILYRYYREGRVHKSEFDAVVNRIFKLPMMVKKYIERNDLEYYQVLPVKASLYLLLQPGLAPENREVLVAIATNSILNSREVETSSLKKLYQQAYQHSNQEAKGMLDAICGKRWNSKSYPELMMEEMVEFAGSNPPPLEGLSKLLYERIVSYTAHHSVTPPQRRIYRKFIFTALSHPSFFNYFQENSNQNTKYLVAFMLADPSNLAYSELSSRVSETPHNLTQSCRAVIAEKDLTLKLEALSKLVKRLTQANSIYFENEDLFKIYDELNAKGPLELKSEAYHLIADIYYHNISHRDKHNEFKESCQQTLKILDVIQYVETNEERPLADEKEEDKIFDLSARIAQLSIIPLLQQSPEVLLDSKIIKLVKQGCANSTIAEEIHSGLSAEKISDLAKFFAKVDDNIPAALSRTEGRLLGARRQFEAGNYHGAIVSAEAAGYRALNIAAAKPKDSNINHVYNNAKRLLKEIAATCQKELVTLKGEYDGAAKRKNYEYFISETYKVISALYQKRSKYHESTKHDGVKSRRSSLKADLFAQKAVEIHRRSSEVFTGAVEEQVTRSHSQTQ